MGLYLEEAMKKFLKEHGVAHGEITESGVHYDIKFEWIGANISMKVIDEFEKEFKLVQQSHSGIEGEKWLDVEFVFDSER